MKWPVALLAFPLSVGLSMLLVSSCGTPGLGIDSTQFGHGGATSSGSGHGGADAGTGATEQSSSSSGFIIDSGPASDGSFGVCVPKTCTELGANCGPMGDGCGAAIQCGGCKSPASCGGGGTPSNCGGNNNCVPATACPAGVNCGPVSDGCGGLVQCGDCTMPGQTCGGGGTPSVCGGNTHCVTITCASKNVNCGPIGDGCGGIVQCGNCTAPQTCGGGGVPGQCGSSSSDAGTVSCVPKTTCPAGQNCGPAGDGCGGQLDCGTCTAPQTCGGGGTPSVCGGNSGCVKHTCAALGLNCGPTGDGCGGQLDCGPCTAPQTCGGGGTPGVCGGFANCVPKTCAQLGFNCGPAGDGCGGLLQCGSCMAPEICGGGGMPGVCGPVDAGAGCTGLCLLQQSCPGNNVTTTITGTVFAPNGTDPLYNATVYVPNGGPAPAYGVTGFTTGVHCGQCGSEISGSPLVSTLSAPDGTFQLQNVPVGMNIPLVIQLGRWRRKITIPAVAACTNTALSAAYTPLPSNQPGSATYPPAWYPAGGGDTADNIPLMAFSTGSVDGLECVLLKIGINQNQFSDPATQGGSGRVRFYQGEGAAGAQISGTTPSATQLYGAGSDGGRRDQPVRHGVLPLPGRRGRQDLHPAGGRQELRQRGRAHLRHALQLRLVHQPDPHHHDQPLPRHGQLGGGQPGTTAGNGTGLINTSFARGQALAQWLQILGASTTDAQMPINTLRTDFTGVVAPIAALGPASEEPAGSRGFTWPMHYTFDTPVGNTPATQCGRALFDDFHVENAGNNTGITFPAECLVNGALPAMTPQEKMLEFMIFDLGSCITPTVFTPPTCTAETCGQQGFNCGPAGDGCGLQLNCGVCMVPGQTCGGGGQPGVCGGVPCNSITCASQGILCGPAGDGCGNVIQCGNCPNGQTCGGGGLGKCGKQTCAPITCASQGIQCGPAGNGCGGVLLCGTCPPGLTCGGGGPGKCGAPDAGTCAPITCAAQNILCGPAGDGCGGQLDCGPCTPPQTCGGGGTPGVCGAPSCTPTTCGAIMCGPTGDGCGGVLQCGPCPSNQTCGGGGVPGVCGATCVPTTCAAQNIHCGPAGDGCGNLIASCGMCTSPDTCGGGGVSGQCGHLSTM